MIPGIVAGAAAGVSNAHPLADIFTGPHDDLWRFNQAGTDAAGTASDPFGTAYGLVNALQLTQAVAGSKPKIRITDGIEVGYFDGGDRLERVFGETLAQPGGVVIAINSTDTSTHIIYSNATASGNRWQLSNSSGDEVQTYASAAVSGLSSPLGRAVISSVYNGASSKQRKSRGLRASGNAGANGVDAFYVGGSAGLNMTGEIVGIAFIGSHEPTEAELKRIENWFYEEMNVMQGGLADVDATLPDLALAFWNLFPDSYIGNCLKVERMSDNTTLDVGFDGSGDLDTAAIAAFCGASDGRLHTWYNQRNGSAGMVGGGGTSATRPRIYVGSTGLMVRNGNGHLALDKGSPVDNRPTLQGAERGPQSFTLMCSFETSDTIFMALGENGDSGEYIGCAENGGASTGISTNGAGSAVAGTYYKNGAAIALANRDAMHDNFATGTPNRFVATLPSYTPGALPTLGWYPSSAVQFRMSAGFYDSYVLTYGSALTAGEIADIDTYLAANLI